MLLALLLASAPAHAAFVKGPYLQHPTASSQVVSFEVDAASSCAVHYGLSALPDQVSASSSGTFHEVQLTGLDPSTTYTYRVDCDFGSSVASTFVTAPHPEEPFTVVVVGDTRTDGTAHAEVIDRVLSTVGHPDLYVNTGDLVEDGGDASQWQTFFDIEAELLRGTALHPVAGNHDDYAQESWYAQYFNLPQGTSGTEGYYALTWADTRLVVVDTEEDYVTGSAQHTWLEAELAAAHADPAIRHILVFFHDPPYTSGAHGVFDHEDWYPPRVYLVPLFERYGVDAVFNGHDHHYERSDAAQTGGVTYVVAGGGGAPGAPEDFVDGIGSIVEWLGMDEGETVGEYLEDHDAVWDVIKVFGFAEDYEEGWWRAEAEVVKHFVYLEIGGGQVAATAYTVDGTLLDEWTLGTYDPSIADDDGDTWTEAEGDCDDADPAIHPGAEDECDGVDSDCDGVDDGCAPEDTDPPVDTDGPVEPEEGCGCASSTSGAWFVPLLALAAIRRARRGSG